MFPLCVPCVSRSGLNSISESESGIDAVGTQKEEGQSASDREIFCQYLDFSQAVVLLFLRKSKQADDL